MAPPADLPPAAPPAVPTEIDGTIGGGTIGSDVPTTVNGEVVMRPETLEPPAAAAEPTL